MKTDTTTNPAEIDEYPDVDAEVRRLIRLLGAVGDDDNLGGRLTPGQVAFLRTDVAAVAEEAWGTFPAETTGVALTHLTHLVSVAPTFLRGVHDETTHLDVYHLWCALAMAHERAAGQPVTEETADV